jgi:hypothetical protein
MSASSERITTEAPGDTRVEYRRNARRAVSSVANELAAGEITAFRSPALFAHFGLPERLEP